MMREMSKGLEFLSENEVEVASSFDAIHGVKAVGPVYTHHADHGQEYAYTDTGAAFQVEWREVFD